MDVLPDIPGWSAQKINHNYAFSTALRYHFFNKNEGYALGGTLVRTTDRGQNWEEVAGFPRPLNSNLRELSVTSSGAVFIVADTLAGNILQQVLIRSANGITNWETIAVNDWTLAYIRFSDTQNGFAFGYDQNFTAPIFLQTTDGGATWAPVTGVVFSNVYSEFRIDWRNASVGLAQTGREQAYLTTDGGQSWRLVSADLSIGATHYLVDQQTLFSLGNFTSRTTDGGGTWLPVNPDQIFVLTIDGQDGLGVLLRVEDCPNVQPGQYAFATSSDGGVSWERTHLLPSILFANRQEVTPGLVVYHEPVKGEFVWLEKE